MATPGGTGALAMSLRNLLAPGQRLLTAAPYWGPYATLAAEHRVVLETAPNPAAGEPLDAERWRDAGAAILAAQGRLVVWLNDPCHNPTGRSLTTANRHALLAVLRDLARQGPVSLILDVAYPDYAREPAAVRAALDDYAALGTEGTVLVGACLSLSKAYTLYGARAGALVFPWCTERALFEAMSTSCRGAFSNCARAPMSVMLRMARDPDGLAELAAEHARWSLTLTARADALDAALHAAGLGGAPWDGGFFVTLPMADAAGVSHRLMDDGVYVVPMRDGVRVGICGLTVADSDRFADAVRRAVAAS